MANFIDPPEVDVIPPEVDTGTDVDGGLTGDEVVKVSQLKVFADSFNQSGVGTDTLATVAVAIGDEVVTLKQLKMLMESIDGGGEQGSVQISYGGNSDANFYFVDAEGIYQSLKNPSSIAVSLPAIIGIDANPREPMYGNNAWVDSVSGGSVLTQGSYGGFVKSCICVVCITESVASISIN